MASRQEIAMVMAKLAAGMPHVTVSSETVDVYCLSLQDMDAQDLLPAAIECLQECEYLPKICELRSKAIRLRNDRIRRMPALPAPSLDIVTPASAEQAERAKRLADELAKTHGWPENWRELR